MKNYVKPQLYFESFELTQNIAGNCGIIMNSGDQSGPNGCTGLVSSGGVSFTYFVGTNPSCQIASENYCYYGFNDLTATFMS